MVGVNTDHLFNLSGNTTHLLSKVNMVQQMIRLKVSLSGQICKGSADLSNICNQISYLLATIKKFTTTHLQFSSNSSIIQSLSIKLFRNMKKSVEVRRI